MFGFVKREAQNHCIMLFLDLLLKNCFAHELHDQLRLLFVQMKGGGNLSSPPLHPTPHPPKRGITVFAHGSVFEDKSNVSVGNHYFKPSSVFFIFLSSSTQLKTKGWPKREKAIGE